MSSRRNLALSDDTNSRIVTLVENSLPNPARPRLGEERELRLADVEARSAACYASCEALTYKIHRLVKDIEKGPPSHDGEQREKIRNDK
jgi:hypothetical protein